MSLVSNRSPWVFIRLAAWLTMLALAGCATQNNVRVQRVGSLTIGCEPGDAEVFIDSRFVGQAMAVGRTGVSLAPGLHRVELRRSGFFSALHEIRIASGVAQRLAVKLRKEPF